jgi:hypothetical protein
LEEHGLHDSVHSKIRGAHGFSSSGPTTQLRIRRRNETKTKTRKRDRNVLQSRLGLALRSGQFGVARATGGSETPQRGFIQPVFSMIKTVPKPAANANEKPALW